MRDGAAECLASVEQLADFIRLRPRLFVVTGAGISRASGIPTYRDEVGTWLSRTPIQHGEFIRDASVRQRYWARSYVGWPHVNKARANPAHSALALLETQGYTQLLVTQNIDRLHQMAGHRRVIDLHGRLDQVVCMDCGHLSAREAVQSWLAEHNPHLDALTAILAPDGDADVADEYIRHVRIPTCNCCDGLLKPNVVFYGSSVSKEIVDYLSAQLLEADAVLVIGTSLMVYSSFRFVRLAADHAIPIVCINQGLTRGDELFTLKVEDECGAALEWLARFLPRAG